MTSLFNYQTLEEENDWSSCDVTKTPDSSWTANFSEDVNTSLADNSCVKQTPSDWSPSKSAEHEDVNSKPDNVKYTALKPKSIAELVKSDGEYGEVEKEVFDSFVNLRLSPAKKPGRTKFRVIVCGLMTACAALLLFTLVYVFVILPSRDGTVVFSDGKSHLGDIAKLRQYGENVVVTSCGLVRGTSEYGAQVFRGIPYALPPTGDRRWRAPSPRAYEFKTCWNDVLNASLYGSKCVQPSLFDTNKLEGSEDCLYLNVWTPTVNPSSPLPVMVWLHSGDLIYGSGHAPGMSPSSRLALETNMVYVSLNFRLGAFGFLAVDQLRRGYHGPAGNYGLMDIEEALRWVKMNIGHFGGDQNKVTIFGHGSGATCVEALLSSPSSSGLYHRAWLTSPVAIINKTLSDACEHNRPFLTASGCTNAECMRKLSPEEVMWSSPWSLRPYWTLDQVFESPLKSQMKNDLAIFDGGVVYWSKANEGPYGVDVPVMIGSTYFDFSSLKTEHFLVNMTWDDYDDTLTHYVSALGTDVTIRAKNLYSNLPKMQYTSPAHFPPEPSAMFARLVGDLKDVCPLRNVANVMANIYTSSVYHYVAEIYPSHNILLASNDVNTFVGWDILAFLGGFEDLEFDPGQGDLNFQNILRQEVSSFVKTGKPSAVRWKPVKENAAGLIGRDVTVMPASAEYFSRCNFWKQHGFFHYTWSVDK